LTAITFPNSHSLENLKKIIKAGIRHLRHNVTAEDTSDGLVSLGFEGTSVKQGIFTEIATFIEPTAYRVEKAELPLQLENAFPTTI
jgi:hypothetical protein